MVSRNPLRHFPERIAFAKDFVRTGSGDPRKFFPGDYTNDILDVSSSERFYLLAMYYNWNVAAKRNPQYIIDFVQKLIVEAETFKTDKNPFLETQTRFKNAKNVLVSWTFPELAKPKEKQSTSRMFGFSLTDEGNRWEKYSEGKVDDFARGVVHNWILEYFAKHL